MYVRTRERLGQGLMSVLQPVILTTRARPFLGDTTATPVLRLEKIQIGSGTPGGFAVGSGGRYQGFFRGAFSSGLPLLKVTGRIEVEEGGKRRPYSGADRKKWRPRNVCAQVRVGGKTGLSSSTAKIGEVKRDGTFTTTTTIDTDGTTRKLRIRVSVKVKGETEIAAEAVLERIDLEGFLAIVDPKEAARLAGQTHLEFLASVRKIYQGAPGTPLEGLFNLFLYRHRRIKPLFDLSTSEAAQLKLYEELYTGGVILDIGHVLTGIEGSRKQDPQKDKTGLILSSDDIETTVTWGGDLGSALYHYSIDYLAAMDSSQPIDLTDYLRRYAGRTDLLGDIDGINIGSAYDASRSLAENLTAYYGKKKFRRFREFIANTKDDSGAAQLTLVPNAKPPRLSKAALSAIARDVSLFARRRLFFSDTYQRLDNDKQRLLNDIASEGSVEMDSVVEYFVRFLEDGLAREP